MSTMLRELSVMNSVAETMKSLTPDEQYRVIMWLLDYFDAYDDEDEEWEDDSPATFVVEDVEPVVIEPTVVVEPEAAEPEPVEPEPHTLETFFAAVAPKTAIQKIVACAYWLETEENHESWKSFEVNKLLKSLDIKVSSVSGTLALEAKKDTPLVQVLDKSGDSMQSRKTFRLSDAGLAFVENRID